MRARTDIFIASALPIYLSVAAWPDNNESSVQSH